MNLSEIYAEYVTKDEKLRDPERLFISDIGKCPRMVAYRMLETPEDFVSEQAHVNKLIMFHLAESIEATLWEALSEQGRGIAYQFEVTMPDRENWGGRGDIIAVYDGGPRIVEVKTVHPGAFKFGLDYPQHRHQAICYDWYCTDEYELTADPILVYFDRGGQNTPVEQVVSEEFDETKALMDELDEVRASLPSLPNKLSKVLKERNYKKDIVQEPDYRCNYCDYQLTCKPDLSKSVWAHRDDTKTPYEPKKSADPTVIEEFLNNLIRYQMED